MSEKYLIPKLPKNKLAKGHNFRKATKGALKLYPHYVRRPSIHDRLVDVLFKHHISDMVDDLKRDYWPLDD